MSESGQSSPPAAVGLKKGQPIYDRNPSIPLQGVMSRPRRKQIGDEKKGLVIDTDSGEVLGAGTAVAYEWEEVDKERFVKLFLSGLKQASGLSKAGLTVFEVVYNQVRGNPNMDQVKLSYLVASKSVKDLQDRTYRRGLHELIEKEFLYRSEVEGVFFVNIRYMFNGDRLAFVKAYHLKGSGPEIQPQLPFELGQK